MGTVTGQSVGIDISEDFLDVYLHPAGKEVRLPHNDEGTAALIALLREQHDRAGRPGEHRGPAAAAGAGPPGGGVRRQRGQPRADLGLSPPGRPGGQDRPDRRPADRRVRRHHAAGGERPAERGAAGDAGADQPAGPAHRGDRRREEAAPPGQPRGRPGEPGVADRLPCSARSSGSKR